jgi:hypothetical protein
MTVELVSDQILTPSRTEVFLAPVGTAVPADPETIPSPWKNVGYTTEDSLSFETSPEYQDFTSAQSDYPVKSFQTADAASFQVDLAQWNIDNFKAVYGGGTISQVDAVQNPLVYKFTPPSIGDNSETAALIRVKEGTKVFLWVIPRSQQTEGVSTSLNKGAASTLPLRLKVLGTDGTAPWYLLFKNVDGFTTA